MENVNDRVHWYLIRVTTRLGGDLVEYIKWEGLPWPVRCKWDWYFKYRAALLQIKYPKYHIEKSWGNIPATGKTLKQILEGKIASKKGQLTKFKSLLYQAKVNWNQIFPIDEEPDYKKAVAKIERLEKEYQELIDQLEETSASSAPLR
jgi:hypothetical protein